MEEGKKENRSKELWNMSIRQFLDEYQREDMYMVASVPPKMAGRLGASVSFRKESCMWRWTLGVCSFGFYF